MNFSPIVLFVYKRLDHVKRVIESLLENEEAQFSDLYIYSDGPRLQSDVDDVLSVRRYCKSLAGFRSVNLSERIENIGLARNIIYGIDEVFLWHDSVIVVEDDLQVSRHFLKYMNKMLNDFGGVSKVWHVNAWNYQFGYGCLPDIYCWRIMNCWGWGTWKDRWVQYEKNADVIIDRMGLLDRWKFNVDGTIPFFSQVIGNKIGVNNTWAIYWYATIYLNNGLCISPRKSLVRNLGSDGSGTHSIMSLSDNCEVWDDAPNFSSIKVEENKVAIDLLKSFAASRRSPVLRIFDCIKFSLPKNLFNLFKYLK